MDWSGVDYLWIIEMFLSAVWTLILTAPIHCRASISEQLMQNVPKSDEETNSCASWITWGRVKDRFKMFVFGELSL